MRATANSRARLIYGLGCTNNAVCRSTRGHKAAMRATFCALEPEGNRYRLPSVRPHGGLLQLKYGVELLRSWNV